MKAHTLARLLLALPNEEVRIIQHYNGQFSDINRVEYRREQDHSTGEWVKDDDGNDIQTVLIE